MHQQHQTVAGDEPNYSGSPVRPYEGGRKVHQHIRDDHHATAAYDSCMDPDVVVDKDAHDVGPQADVATDGNELDLAVRQAPEALMVMVISCSLIASIKGNCIAILCTRVAPCTIRSPHLFHRLITLT